MGDTVNLRPDNFYDNLKSIFLDDNRLTTMCRSLNHFFWDEIRFEILNQGEWSIVRLHDAALEHQDISSFHDLEDVLKQLLLKEEFIDNKNLQVEFDKFVHSLIALWGHTISLPYSIMPKVSEIYKQETEEILRIERKNALGEDVFSLYNELDIIKSEKYFQVKSLWVQDLYQLMKNSDSAIDLDKLCWEDKVSIWVFIRELGWEWTVEALSKTTKSFKSIVEDWYYRAKNGWELDLKSYIK